MLSTDPAGLQEDWMNPEILTAQTAQTHQALFKATDNILWKKHLTRTTPQKSDSQLKSDQIDRMALDASSLVPCVVPIGQHEDEEESWMEIINDLSAAVEVNFSSGWRTIYPSNRLRIERTVEIAVRLRDSPDICGICRGVANGQYFTSFDFGDFGRRALCYTMDEFVDAERATRLREAQQKELRQRERWFFMRYGCNLCIVLCMWAVILVVFIMAPLENYAIAIAVVLGIGASGCCMSSSLRWSLYLMGKRIAAWRSVYRQCSLSRRGPHPFFIPIDFASWSGPPIPNL